MKSQKLLDSWEWWKYFNSFFLRTLLVLEIIAICANKVGISAVPTLRARHRCFPPFFPIFSVPLDLHPGSPLLAFVRSFVTLYISSPSIISWCFSLFDRFLFFASFLSYTLSGVTRRSILFSYIERFYDYRLTTFSFPAVVCQSLELKGINGRISLIPCNRVRECMWERYYIFYNFMSIIIILK